MKIYIGHSRSIDYINDLYKPMRQLSIEDEIILPHEINENNQNDREFYQSLDIFIAEVSSPSTGLGIELGWAFDNNIPIVCIYKTGAQISGSLKSVTNYLYEYSNADELKKIICKIIKLHSI